MMRRLDALNAIYGRLEDAIVVTIMGAVAAELQSIGHRPNFFYLQHAMGLASSMGLGIALSRPDRQVVVLDRLRQVPVGRVERQALRDGPRAQDAADLEAQIEVQPRGVVLLEHEAAAHGRSCRSAGALRRCLLHAYGRAGEDEQYGGHCDRPERQSSWSHQLVPRVPTSRPAAGGQASFTASCRPVRCGPRPNRGTPSAR